jgi:hypothetical protein
VNKINNKKVKYMVRPAANPILLVGTPMFVYIPTREHTKITMEAIIVMILINLSI